MTLLYRALWTDTTEPDRGDVVSLSRDSFVAWAAPDAETALADGEHRFPAPTRYPATRIVQLTSVDDAGRRGFRGRVSDVPDNANERSPLGESAAVWRTTLTVLATDDGVHTLADNEMETDDVANRIKVGRPRVVEDLLSLPGSHCLGGSRLNADVVHIPAEGIPILVESLTDPSRTLPVLVFTEPPPHMQLDWRYLAQQTIRRAAGVATVVTLDHSAVNRLREHLGPLAVWGGGVRTYNPAPLNPADAWRHRYIPGSRLLMHSPSSIDRLVYASAELSTRRRVPEVFALDDRSGDTTSSQQIYDLAFMLEQAREDQEESERELNRALGHLRRLSAALAAQNLSALYWGSHDQPNDPEAIPDIVQDVQDAVLNAQQHLADWLSLPDAAVRELEGIDTAPNAFAWANSIWRGLRSLAGYAEARATGFEGNFWIWCERGDSEWPATTKKLAMRESESVAENARWAQARRFPVNKDLDAGGVQYMEAHLKISEGGGDLAPRVYFHDDTGGVTKKVHVGFIGPHYLVPNTKS